MGNYFHFVTTHPKKSISQLAIIDRARAQHNALTKKKLKTNELLKNERLKRWIKNRIIEPFKNGPALDGYHFQTNSGKNILSLYSSVIRRSAFGSRRGNGFYLLEDENGDRKLCFHWWSREQQRIFFNDLGKRTGVKITTVSTSSQLAKLQRYLMKLERNSQKLDWCLKTQKQCIT